MRLEWNMLNVDLLRERLDEQAVARGLVTDIPRVHSCVGMRVEGCMGLQCMHGVASLRVFVLTPPFEESAAIRSVSDPCRPTLCDRHPVLCR